MNILHINITTI